MLLFSWVNTELKPVKLITTSVRKKKEMYAEFKYVYIPWEDSVYYCY